VLTQAWGAASELPGGGRQRIGGTGVAQCRAEFGVLDFDKKLPRLQLWTFDQVTCCLHWRQRHTIVLRLGVGLLLALGGEKRVQGRVHLRIVLKAIDVVSQALVGQRPYSPFGGEPGDQTPPAKLASTEERNIAILTGQDIGGSLPSMPPTRAYLAVKVIRLVRCFERIGHCSLHRHIHVLALASHLTMPERNQCPHRPIERRQMIALQPARWRRWTVWFTAQIGQATHGEADNIRRLVMTIGPGAAKTRDGRHDEMRMAGAQMPKTEPQTVEIPGRKGFHEGIGGCQESVQERLTSGGLQVQGNTALVRMKVPEKQALFRIGLLLIKWPTIPCRVPRWRFDLDDVGSQVSQYFGAQDTWRSAQVKDTVATQRAGSVVAPSLHCCISPLPPVVSGWGHSQTTVVPLLASLWIASEALIMLAR
jgi:hypothetical protein